MIEQDTQLNFTLLFLHIQLFLPLLSFSPSECNSMLRWYRLEDISVSLQHHSTGQVALSADTPGLLLCEDDRAK